ncbi:MAG: pantoate--beta-alanine ligase [Candidatus Omnitrophica bacterium]|nr:pantoate--beta-alanine ligase [Candidatus Omnitrophota bacterium]
MKIISSLKRMQLLSRALRARHKRIGFVATMGALHQGHLRLLRMARRENDVVVASIFVNPIQFGPSEDFKRYPRDLKRDSFLCRKEGVDIIFKPLVRAIYPDGYKTYVYVEGLSEELCGKFRKEHFRGITTIVAKLLNIVSPDIAYFGRKDAQQAIIIKKMVKDLNMPFTIKVIPTLRGPGGLALSSRNIYLSKKEQSDALVLSQSLSVAKSLVKKGLKDTSRIINKMRQLIKKKRSARIEYIAIVDPKELHPLKRVIEGALISLAVRIGKTRLIDNITIKL